MEIYFENWDENRCDRNDVPESGPSLIRLKRAHVQSILYTGAVENEFQISIKEILKRALEEQYIIKTDKTFKVTVKNNYCVGNLFLF